VHGVQGLRVAGAAVMPVVVNAPPAAASLMIGDRAADFLLAGPTARP
jgi:choline dehydrogenase